MILSSSPKERIAICLLLLAFLCAMIPGLHGFGGDVPLWGRWAGWNAAHGLPEAYGSGSDYMPLFHYPLWLFGKLMGTPDAAMHNAGYIRILTLLVDFWALYLAYRWVGRRPDYLLFVFLSVFNIGYSYDTVIWGQVDAISSALAFAALYYLYRSKMALSAVMMVLAVNMKLQAIIFLPLWGLLGIGHLARTRRYRDAAVAVLSMIVVQALLLLPFAAGSGGLKVVWNNALGLVGSYNFVSCNGFNIWYWIMALAPGEVWTHDNDVFFAGLSYRAIGQLLFCLAALAAFLPLLRITYNSIFSKERRTILPPSRDVILLTAALTAILFFFLCTEMHERYAQPAAIFLTAYAFATRKWAAYILFSIACFLNLEAIMQWLGLPNYGTVLFDGKFVAGIFAAVIIMLFRSLYRLQRVNIGVGERMV